MSDEDLLLNAAKAINLQHRGYWESFVQPDSAYHKGLIVDTPNQWLWNPLVDSYDAFSLMVKLELTVECWRNTEDIVRRAVTLAAARIGESL